MNVERFLIQVRQNLPEHEGVTTWIEDSALNVGYGKTESFEIRYPGGICYNAATEKTDEFYKLIEEADKAFKTVKEYIDLMDNAPELSARDFNMPYKLLAEFNGVVLGGIEHRSNNTFEFTTWSYANNSLYHGHYFTDYEKAKEDFAVKKAYVLLNEYFKTMYLEEMISKNPMDNVEMIKKANFLSVQGKEYLPECETITIFTKEEVEKFKAEINKPKYTQAYAYILMLNTGLRTGEMLGVLNNDIDLDKKTMKIKQAVKTIEKRDGTKSLSKKDIKVGKTKSATSKRVVPLNKTAIDMIIKLREERYFGENTPLVCDENGGYTKPYSFRNRYYTILKNAGIETKGMHALRHTFASNLVNGIKQSDGSIKALSPKQVADILGHTTSQITEMYYVKRDNSRLNGVTDGFEI